MKRIQTETVDTELRVSLTLGMSTGGGDAIPSLRIEDDRSGLTLLDLQFEAADLANMLSGRSVKIGGTVTTDSEKVGKHVVAHQERIERGPGSGDTEKLAEARKAKLAEDGIVATVRHHNYGHSVIHWTYHDEPQNDWQREGS